MGEITVDLELENFGDRVLQQSGYEPEESVRRLSVKAVVDTGAVMLVLPQDVVTTLGLQTQRTVIVAYADERKEERPVAGAVTLRIGNRTMTTECIVGPPLSEPLIGQVVLEELDLLPDCQQGRLIPLPPISFENRRAHSSESGINCLICRCKKSAAMLSNHGLGQTDRW